MKQIFLHPYSHPHFPHLPLLIITNPQQSQLFLPSPKPFFTKHRTQLGSHMHLPFPQPQSSKPKTTTNTLQQKHLISRHTHTKKHLSDPQQKNHNLSHPTKPIRKNNSRKQVRRAWSAQDLRTPTMREKEREK